MIFYIHALPVVNVTVELAPDWVPKKVRATSASSKRVWESKKKKK